MFNTLLLLLQLLLTVVMGIYFLNALQGQRNSKSGIENGSARELDKLHRLKEIKLTKPLSEKTRPATLTDIVGQEDGIRALRAALCGPNPQHILIYGPPGVGKTAAARAVLQEAIRSDRSPFRQNANFIEMDATTLRFDERGIADPLIGSVHDPIYQGAGAYGPAGVPQPKPGAVTKAHGGVLFLDEIGELHPTQMNKLLKVLEDRMVFLESAYYASGNKDIPPYVHEIFQKGLPADFRLIGATTRSPEDIPPALRSRCVEIFFSSLSSEELYQIAKNAAAKAGFTADEKALSLACSYAQNGRDAVNIIQTAGSVASLDDRHSISTEDVEWVAESSHYIPRYEKQVTDLSYVGLVNGLAVFASSEGTVMDVEVTATPCSPGKGGLTVTGIVESEELEGRGQRLARKSSARASIENMLTLLGRQYGIDTSAYHLHINFPGGTPIDGPSAGTAIMTAVYSAITGTPVSARLAFTGEISIHGRVMPVGGVSAKIAAAKRAGIQEVYIPKDNFQESYQKESIRIIPVRHISEIFTTLFGEVSSPLPVSEAKIPVTGQLISARTTD